MAKSRGKIKARALFAPWCLMLSETVLAEPAQVSAFNNPLFLFLTVTLMFVMLVFGHRQFKRLTQNKKEANHIAQSYLKIINQYVITSKTDLEGNILDVSDAFCQISGFSKEELVNHSHAMVRHPNTPDETYQSLWQSISEGRDWQGEMCNQRKDGTSYWVYASITANYDMYGRKVGYIAVHQDITDHKMVVELSIRDALTGLYNRRHFNHYFEQHLQDCYENNRALSLIIFDIDNFKKYNDTYGHQKGDDVLKETAAVLQYCTGDETAACFRLGGEEFAIIIQQDETGAEELAERIRAEIEDLGIEHINNANYGVVTTSVGFYTYHTDEFSPPEPDELFRVADQSLYRAKESGRNQVCGADMAQSSIELF
ncbi:MAG: hypothetical protein CMI12_03825 [Oceanospirillum sp.]|nr:hypothetical protein [Oceanospirillum sp.]